jgi:hypothetical protein
MTKFLKVVFEWSLKTRWLPKPFTNVLDFSSPYKKKKKKVILFYIKQYTYTTLVDHLKTRKTALFPDSYDLFDNLNNGPKFVQYSSGSGIHMFTVFG